MRLHQLFHEFDPQQSLEDVADVEIRGICEDSRVVKPGDLFVARVGICTEGLKFIADAVARGAVAVVGPIRLATCILPQVPVDDAGSAVAKLAHIFYRNPTRSLRVMGITGTNGKTSTVYLIRHLLKKVNKRCGLIGTIEIDDGRNIHEATMTTPGAVDVAKLLATMRDNNCDACAMEVSSHALEQGRVSGIRFAGGAFTNLTGDHLDYHGTMEKYAAAKEKLFHMLGEDSVAVINGEDEWSVKMIEKCAARVIRFGFGVDADYVAKDIAVTAAGSRFILKTPDGEAEAEMVLIGRHNIANALTAAAMAGEVFGLSVHQLAAGLKDAPAAPGRLQAVRAGQPFAVLVDYAHTDDALENVLTALRPLTQGKLRVLFGCGGDRDRTKRPRMACIAAKFADIVYVSSDNPRTENPRAILDDIIAGFPKNNSTPVIVEPDRRAAIERVLHDSEKGDVVLLAGKGHENYQIIGTTKHHFDDAEEAGRILKGAWAA
jgi:UDP-N-acetylmuramoyl-L-alanyl-D-glutamate--2,6-diaminopimelate ligase